MEYYTGALSDWADFSGRADRTEFWMFILIHFVVSILLVIVDSLITGGILIVLYSVVMIVPIISATTRRLHDTGRTGWWQLVYFIPAIGGLILLFLVILGSEDYNNPYD
jgi:uncharacterized membrane protein YhaH (DUF805 family)